MKFWCLFSGNKKKYIIDLSSTEFAKRVVYVKTLNQTIGDLQLVKNLRMSAPSEKPKDTGSH